MKSIQKTKRSKKLLITSLVTLLLIAVGLLWSILHWQQENDIDDSKTSTSQQDVSGNQSVDPSASIPIKNKTPVQNGQTEQKSEPNTLIAQITSVQNYDNNLQIRTLIEAVTNSGNCSLSLVKDNQTYSTESGIQALAKSSTCKGFDIPMSELSPDTWNLTITIESNGRKAHLTQEVSL